MPVFANPTALPPVQVGGYRCRVDAYAADDDGFVFASLLGAVTVVEAVWAYLVVSHGGVELANHVSLSRIPERQSLRDEDAMVKTRYRKSVARLPDSEATHLLVVAETAMLPGVNPDIPAYLISDSPDGDLLRFFAIWDKLLPFPARPEWAEFLWKAGLRRNLISPLPETHGCHTWKIIPDRDTWQTIVTGGVEDGALTVSADEEELWHS